MNLALIVSVAIFLAAFLEWLVISTTMERSATISHFNISGLGHLCCVPTEMFDFFLLTGHKSNVDPTPERKFFIPIPGDTDVGPYIGTEVSYLVCLGLTKLVLL